MKFICHTPNKSEIKGTAQSYSLAFIIFIGLTFLTASTGIQPPSAESAFGFLLENSSIPTFLRASDALQSSFSPFKSSESATF